MRYPCLIWLAMLVVAQPLVATAQGDAASDAAAIEAWLNGYDAAFNAKDLDTLATFHHADVTIYEGGGVNIGWADYRDIISGRS